MALQASGLNDLLKATLESIPKLKMTDITSHLQKHIALSMLMKGSKVVTEPAGTSFKFDVMTRNSGSARYVGLGAQDVVGIEDVLTRGEVEFRHVTWNWSIVHQEVSMNADPLTILNLTKVRRLDALISATELFESKFWRVPASTNTTDPFGIPYWIVKNATEGFYGQLPSGYTTVAGITPSSHLQPDGRSKWANWTFQYTAVTREDLLRKWRKAATYTDFDTPVPDMQTFDTGEACGYYTVYDVVSELVEILQTNNDNLGSDLAKFHNSVMFMNKSVVEVPALRDDTTNPIYGIPWGEFHTHMLRGEWMRETVVPVTAGQHNLATTHTDCTHNWAMRNRRKAFVGATGTTLPA